MDGDRESEGTRVSSRRERRSRPGDGPKVAVVRRKPRNRGMFGWLRKSVYNPRSPLITLAMLVAGFALIAVLLFLFTNNPADLPKGLKGSPGAQEAPPPALRL